MNPLVSVIVPIHNTEKYLEKCLASVCNQTLGNIEILCVDDQSSDSSADIVRELATTDSRIKLIRHEAQYGCGGARNTGVKTAKAGYIASVDSDDWMDSTMLQTLYDATENESFDIVSCGWKRVNQDGVCLSEQGRKPDEFDNTNNQVNIFELLNPALWNKLIRKSLFTENKVEFPRFIMYEDLATTPRLVAYANTIRIIADTPYHYVARENSEMSTFNNKRLMSYFETFAILRKFLLDNNLYERYEFDYRGMLDKHLSFCCKDTMQSHLDAELKASFMRYIYFLKTAFLAEIDSIESMSSTELQEFLIQR